MTPETAPLWAYPVNPTASDTKALPDTSLKHVPGSQIAFYLKDLGNRNRAPGWHPEYHTPMPDVVLLGNGKDVSACANCHLPTGAERPENASLAGLSKGYLINQIAEFKSGTRSSSVPGRPPRLYG